MNEKMPAVLNFAPEPFSVELCEIPVPEIGELNTEILAQNPDHVASNR